MNLSQRLRLAVCALFIGFLAGCGSSSSQTAPSSVLTFSSASAIFQNHSSAMYMSGYNAFGQLGTGNLDSQSHFSVPTGLGGKVKGFSLGGAHAVAFLADGTAQAWGSNQFGQLGNAAPGTGPSVVSKVPLPVKKNDGTVLTNVTGVAAGGYHSLAISGGTVYAWGLNSSGQLGDETFDQKNQAVQVLDSNRVPLSDVIQVAAGGSFSLALKSTGEVFAWGNNTNGQLSIGTPAPSFANMAYPVPALAGKKVIAIAAGGSYAVALVDDNTVYAWGYDYWGEIGVDPTTLGTDLNGKTIQYVTAPTQIFKVKPDPNVPNDPGVPLLATKIAAGSDHVLALEKDTSTVWGWGQDYYGQLGSNNKNATGTAAGAGHTGDQGVALFFSITPLQVVSSNTAGIGGAGLAGVQDIYAYGNSSFAMLADGTLYAWGDNTFGQLGFAPSSSISYQENPVVVTGFPR